MNQAREGAGLNTPRASSFSGSEAPKATDPLAVQAQVEQLLAELREAHQLLRAEPNSARRDELLAELRTLRAELGAVLVTGAAVTDLAERSARVRATVERARTFCVSLEEVAA